MARPVLLLTRPRKSAEAFAAALDPAALAGVTVLIAPVMEILSNGSPLLLADGQDVIFTSSNGVLHAPDGQGRVAYCVGAQTTRQAIARGWIATQEGDTAQELIAALQATPPVNGLLHLAGVHTRGDIAQTLTSAGILTRHVALYDQRLSALGIEAFMALSGLCILPVFSPRAGERLIQEASGRLENAHIVALSEAVAAPFSGEKTAGLLILATPRAVSMRKAVEKLCRALALP